MIQLPRFIVGAALGAIMTTLPMKQAQAGVFVHLFEWKWSDVAQECENYSTGSVGRLFVGQLLTKFIC